MNESFERRMQRALRDFDEVWARVGASRPAADARAMARAAGLRLMPGKAPGCRQRRRCR